MLRTRVSVSLLAAILLSAGLVACQKQSAETGTVSSQDIQDVASILADSAGGMNDRPAPIEPPPPRMVFTKQDIPNEGGYLQVSIGDVNDDEANRFMRRLKSEACTCGCPHTIDQCLIEDPQCDVAHRLARQVLKEVTEGA